MPTESPEKAARRSSLGRYLQVLAILQMTLYGAAMATRAAPLPSFDPRLMLYVVHSFAVPGRQEFPTWISWASAVGLFALGSGVVASRRWLGVYVVVEGVFALAFLGFGALVIAANLSPAHGFSVRELLVPFLVFVFFSAGPLLVALPLWRADDW